MNNIYPKISIVSPSHNPGQFTEQAITSVLEQGYRNSEHMILDNCSTDQTIAILELLARGKRYLLKGFKGYYFDQWQTKSN